MSTISSPHTRAHLAMDSRAVSYPLQKVCVVDDDIITRILLKEVFHSANLVVETYASAEDFLAAYKPDLRGCLILDNSMPGMNGIELQETLAADGNKTPVIFLTGAGDVSIAARALKSGAIDFLEKPVEPSMILGCVNKALALDRRNEQTRMEGLVARQRMSQLTPRENEVVEWLYQGKSADVIAHLLGISGSAVALHQEEILEKVQLDSLPDLVALVLLSRQ